MQEKQRYRAIKLLLFPRLTTIWDLFLMLSESSVNLKEILEEHYELKGNLDIKLIQLTLRQLKTLVKKTPEGVIIGSDDLTYWLKNSCLILDTLIEMNETESARAFVLEFISTLFFLITVYVMKKVNSGSETQKFLSQFKFDETAITKLIGVFSDKDLLKSFNKLGIMDLFDLLTRFYSISIKKMLEYSDIDKENKIFIILDPFFKFSDEEELLQLYDKVINLAINEKNYFLMKVIISSLIILIEGLSREILKTNRSTKISYLKKFLEKIIRANLSREIDITYRDFSILGVYACVKILYNIVNNEIDAALNELNKLGSTLLREKVNLIGVTERVTLKLPPETFSLPPPFTPPPIELRDRLSSSTLLMIVNEILDEVISSGMERKNILKSALILAPNNFKKFLFRSIVDPLSSLALMFLIGIPSVFLFETIIFISTQHDKGFSTRITNEIINTLDKLMKAKDSVIKRLEKKYFHSYPDYTQVASFYVYRDVFFISLLMTDKIREELIKSRYGKELMETLENIYKYLEKIYGRAPIVRREDISELFA